jgi:hypothetical protein
MASIISGFFFHRLASAAHSARTIHFRQQLLSSAGHGVRSEIEEVGQVTVAATSRLERLQSRMVRKLDLHEDAMVRYCDSAVAIMDFEYSESARPIPVYADRCFRVDEPRPTAGH